MQKQYTKEELWKVFNKLPDELKEAVFSQETADHVFNVCERNDIEEVSRVAYWAGLVLMGVLAPNNFQKTLQKELGLKEDVAASVATEINRFVFYPVRPALEQLHSIEVGTAEKTGEAKAPARVAAQPLAQEQAKAGPAKEDTYREPIE